MMKTNKQTTWDEVFRLNRRALKLFYKRYPKLVLSRFAGVVWNALTPYVAIFLSALVIDELVGERNVERLQMLVLIALIVGVVTGLGTALLDKWKEVYGAGWLLKVEHIFSEKMLDTDYINLDDAKTAEKLSAIRQSMMGSGWGLYQVIESYESLVSCVFTILGGLALTISLFTSKVPDSAGTLTVLNRPVVCVGVIFLMLLCTFIAPVLDNKQGVYWAKYAGSHNLANRLLDFFGLMGYRNEIAADVRMYRQDEICDKYNRNKQGIFGSDGIFAHLARGPMGFYGAAAAAVSVAFTGVVYAYVCLKAMAGAFYLGSVTQYVSSIAKVSGGMSSFLSALGMMRNNAPFLKMNFEYLDIPDLMYQ